MKREVNHPTLSERKARLEERSSLYREALNTDLQELKVDLRKWGKTFLIVAGSLYGVYKIVKLLRGSPADQEDVPPDSKLPVLVQSKQESVVVNKIKEQIALFLLGIAMQKIKSFINEKQDEKGNT